MTISSAPRPTWPAPGELHVWLRRVTAGSGTGLADEERARAARFRRAADRRRYVTARETLRRLLGAYLDCSPADLRLALSPAGKPFLPEPVARGLRFNLSHGGALVAVAVAAGAEVGVDVEPRRPLDDLPGMARQAFAPAELAAWQALPPRLRPAAFFATWAGKEALLKAAGSGLLRDPRDVSLGLLRRGGPVVEHRDAAGALWSVAPLDLPPRLAGAAAVAGPLLRLRLLRLE